MTANARPDRPAPDRPAASPSGAAGAGGTRPAGETRPADGERRRGRRPGGTDTRAALLAAAREVFSENGYDGATVRAIARRAGVDAAMVNHWFGGKEALFTESVLRVPFNPKQLVEGLLQGDPADLGARIVRTFLTAWDAQGGGVFAALIRSVASHERVAAALRDFFVHQVFRHIVPPGVQDQRMLRANLVASQLIGMGVLRYVARFEPLAGTDVETMVCAVGPTLQRYLTGPIEWAGPDPEGPGAQPG